MKPFLSILIPIFNENIEQLIESLIIQIANVSTFIEIICIDDASTHKQIKINNKRFATDHGFFYEELSQNIGRSAIRNRLARSAKGEFILFLDCDIAILNPDYIHKIVNSAQSHSIFSGGTTYQKEKPKEKSKILHWLAGYQKEDLSLEKKRKTPLAGFSLNNLCIKREIFLQINLDSSLTQYGHEDTLFGYYLIKEGFQIHFIENKVLHLGLNNTENFISKNFQAIENLVFLKTNKNIDLPTKLTKVGNLLLITRLSIIYLFLFSIFEKIILKNLHSDNPNLVLFDLLKLNFYLKIINK